MRLKMQATTLGVLMAETLDTPNNLVSPQHELLECDIVMAGGVTSGIIYPGAVAMIARRYLFRSIGGTSVGAIAAAVTAAAEYGRRTGKNPRGFEQLAALPNSLGDTANDGHSRLFHLFTPEPFTKPLLALVTPLFGGGGLARQIARVLKVGLLAWQVWLPVLLVTLAGLTVIVSLLIEGHSFLSVVSILTAASFVLLTWVAMLIVVLWRHWLPNWRANGYGICTGYASPQCGMKGSQADLEGLTPWMHRIVQSSAGRSPDEQPLTFGDLWSASSPPAPATIGVDLFAPRAIELSMIASDISRNRTVQIPFLEAPSPMYIEIAVLDRYFPASIVEWMKDHAGEHDKRIEAHEGIIRLPNPQNIPVVFGARLSLSFPVLLSALPLMTPDFGKGKNTSGYIPLRRVWFSDGGLTSNFPIHFFDSPIPSRPTFCLNLVDFDAEAPNVEADGDVRQEEVASASERGLHAKKPIAQPRATARTAANRPQIALRGDPEPGDPVWGFVSMARGNRFSPAPFTAFDTAPGAGLASFFQTLLNTARFWSDNQMLIAPGVRDRVVNIALREDEGGLNLDMSPAVIADLDQRGRAAGLLISARFDPEQPIDPETGMANEQIFANHRWVRFRNFMSSFEDLAPVCSVAARIGQSGGNARRISTG